MARTIRFNGRDYILHAGYFKAKARNAPNALHRARWEYYRGPIPEGFEIHHKDGDGTNNKLSNLELVEGGEHARMHALERIARGELKPPSRDALVLAALWHASPEGRAWHSTNGKRIWKDRVWHTLECQECGREFKSPYPNKAKFCHLNCKMAALRRRRGRPVGTRPGGQRVHKLRGKRAPV